MDWREEYKRIVSFMGKVQPRIYETYLCEIKNRESEILAQSVRVPETYEHIRGYLSSLIREKRWEAGDTVAEQLIPQGDSLFKVKVMFIYDEDGQVGGMLVNSLKCNTLIRLEGILGDIFERKEENIREEFQNPVGEMSLDCIEQIALEYQENGVIPLKSRMEYICELYELGVFERKGTIPRVASCIGCSEKTVYRYVSDIRKARS